MTATVNMLYLHNIGIYIYIIPTLRTIHTYIYKYINKYIFKTCSKSNNSKQQQTETKEKNKKAEKL